MTTVSKTSIPLIQYNYFDAEGEQNFISYKYCGNNYSFYYDKVLSPFCDWLVKKWVPRSWAPNMMTVLGFVFIIFGHAWLYFDTPEFQNPCYKPLSYFVFGFSVFLYHVLDSSDGKQARKINNCSPLGMILDHGLDSISITLMFMPFGQMIGAWDHVICCLIW